MPNLIDIVKKGSTDRSVTVRIIDDTTGLAEEAVEHNSSGIALWYRREGEAKTSITPVSLASLTTAHADGGIEHIDDGDYRVDVPDAAFSAGANHVDIGGTVSGMIVLGGRVRLVDYDPESSSDLGLSNLDAAMTSRQPSGPVTVSTNNDKAGYSLASGPLDAAGVRSAIGLASADLDTQIGTLATPGDAMTLTSGERTTLAGALEAAIINELDGTAVMQAIADLIADDMTTGDLTVQAIASAVRDAILDRVLSGNHDAAGTPGALLQNVDATVSSRSSLDEAGVRDAVGLSSANLDTQFDAIPTASENADATWEELIADHSGTSGSTAESLNAAGGSGDPWTTTLPGSYSSGQAGYIVGNLNDLDDAGVRAALGMDAADLDAQLAAIFQEVDVEIPAVLADIETAVDTEVQAILYIADKLDGMLEDDGASGFQFTALALDNAPSGGGGGGDATLDNQNTIISTVNAIKTITDTLPAGVKVIEVDADAVEDIFSTHNIAEGYTTKGDDGTPGQLLYELLQTIVEASISGNTLTVRQRDGSTVATTHTLTGTHPNITARSRAT